jgi:hypothetical protein
MRTNTFKFTLLLILFVNHYPLDSWADDVDIRILVNAHSLEHERGKPIDEDNVDPGYTFARSQSTWKPELFMDPRNKQFTSDFGGSEACSKKLVGLYQKIASNPKVVALKSNIFKLTGLSPALKINIFAMKDYVSENGRKRFLNISDTMADVEIILHSPSINPLVPTKVFDSSSNSTSEKWIKSKSSTTPGAMECPQLTEKIHLERTINGLRELIKNWNGLSTAERNQKMDSAARRLKMLKDEKEGKSPLNIWENLLRRLNPFNSIQDACEK